MLIKAGKKNLIAVAKLDSRTFSTLCEMPGRKYWVGRQLHFVPVAANIAHLHKSFPEAKWEPSAQPHLDKYIALLQTEQRNRIKKERAPSEAIDAFEFKTTPYKHQYQAFYISRDAKVFALLMEQGTGKSKVLLDTAAYNYSLGKIEAVAIVAPNNVHRNWIDIEVPTHLPDWCPREAMAVATTMTKTREKEYARIVSEKKALPILAFNVEAFRGGNVNKGGSAFKLEMLLSSKKTLLILDESQKIKNPSAQQTKKLTKLAPLATMRRIATGTPITQGMEDAFAQWRFLDEDILGFDSFYTFRNHYCVMGGFEGRAIVGYKNVEEIVAKTQAHSFRVLKKDCLDLPKKIYKRHIFELSPLQRKVFDELKREFATTVRGKRMEVALELTRLLRLQQITCNWFTTEPGERPKVIDTKNNPRLATLFNVIADHPGKFVIWSRFTADIKLIAASLSEKFGARSVVTLWGETKLDDRGKNIKRFQEDTTCRFFVGQQQAGGVGITLTAATNTVYYSNTFSLEDRLQSEDRNHRIGTKQHVIYHDLEARKTGDRKIINALRAKKQVADLVNQDPASFFLEMENEEPVSEVFEPGDDPGFETAEATIASTATQDDMMGQILERKLKGAKTRK